ncbi:hypothetical protein CAUPRSCDRAFT_12904 [Caulochytrium protostelioides]|uniref:Uncharacterized protein n=1 Tax=Caulochytrium protostelioides TaxID=1555241 RepID=A0A4P9WQG0_9FUNG|nr:hypothetical protein CAUPRSCDRAFT_12904 [Caulochytrium protostelioides]
MTKDECKEEFDAVLAWEDVKGKKCADGKTFKGIIEGDQASSRFVRLKAGSLGHFGSGDGATPGTIRLRPRPLPATGGISTPTLRPRPEAEKAVRHHIDTLSSVIRQHSCHRRSPNADRHDLGSWGRRDFRLASALSVTFLPNRWFRGSCPPPVFLNAV